MDESQLQEELLNEIRIADSLSSMFRSDGWSVVKKKWDEPLADLKSIDGITTIKQLEGKQWAYKKLAQIMKDLIILVDRGEDAKKTLSIEPEEVTEYRIKK